MARVLSHLLASLLNHFGRPPRPLLVSLDLGFNDLTDLQNMIMGLSTLKHLRLLVLQGNPLALVPYYRGFTVDSLARLCVLDDITVSPNEKHQFRGLNTHGGRYRSHVPASASPTSLKLPAAPHLALTLVRYTKLPWSGLFLCRTPAEGIWGIFCSLWILFLWWLEITPL